MKNIFKALNVASEKELNNLVESLNLEINDYINFMSMLNETLEPQTIRDNLFQLTESLYNGSYEKLQEHISKKPFERKLKEETVYDHSWYEVKKQKYPKRTKDGMICESKEDIELENDVENDSIEEPKQKSSADPEITQFINTTEKVVNNTTNPDILKGLIDSIDAKITLSTDIEQTNKLSELKQKAETKIVSVKNVKSVMESFDNNSKSIDVNIEIDSIEWDYGEYDPTIPTECSTTISMTIDELKDCFILGEGDTIDDFSDRDITDALFESTFNIEKVYDYLDELSGGISSSSFNIEIENIDEIRNVLKYIFQEEDNIDEEPETSGEEFDESVNYDYYVPNFYVGDNVEFVWNNEKYTGRVIDVIDRGSYEYYNVISYVEENQREETFTHVDPIDNEMKKIISDDELDETCSAGATGVSNVSGFSKPIGKTIKRNKKKVKETFDSKLFKESILNDMECSSKINGKQLIYFLNEGKYYLSVDNALVKTYDKDVMIETVDEILYDEDISYKLLEGYSCYEMDILMEDAMANPLNPKIQSNSEQKEPTSLEDSERNKELLDIMNSKKEISVVDDDSMEIINNQEIVNKDEQSGNYFVKDKMTNEITLVDPNSIKVEK